MFLIAALWLCFPQCRTNVARLRFSLFAICLSRIIWLHELHDSTRRRNGIWSGSSCAPETRRWCWGGIYRDGGSHSNAFGQVISVLTMLKTKPGLGLQVPRRGPLYHIMPAFSFGCRVAHLLTQTTYTPFAAMSLVSGPGRGSGGSVPHEELKVHIDSHVRYIQSLDTASSTPLPSNVLCSCAGSDETSLNIGLPSTYD